jgi:mannose-6-phosphate isomerase class I
MSFSTRHSLDILICIEGEVVLSLQDKQMILTAGQSAMLPAIAATYQLTGEGIVFKAGVPIA